ncbi:PH domain-containing protein [Sphingomonas sp.]|uniref:PH domain-containing protein n=1 Tax=Sphingomonas sp. TaxID=28214 RepID=UPI001DC910A1|nr:PH domain-containing protein [Sphingomonas sp.]MBX9795953.1 PH domain-containing protein [Sphingomonas sp.]
MEQSIAKFRPSTWRWLLGTLAGWGTLLLCLVGVGLVIVAVMWFRNIATHYELTDQRLIIRSGIFAKRIDEIELFRVKDTLVNYSLVNQLTGIGAITIRSSDATTGGHDLVLRDIPQALHLREEMRRLVEAARQKRRVRELDIDVEQ